MSTNIAAARPTLPDDMERAFPDPVFRAYVLRNFDTDGDGRISPAEAEAVTEIDVSNDWDTPDSERIRSLEGVEYFPRLTRLDCYYNHLTALDMSWNTALEELNCSENRLTSLDVSQNTELTVLDCFGNQLRELNVRHNTALILLSCYDNRLTTLDVSHNTKLTFLDCCDNRLISLDVSHNTALTLLYCGNQLTTLDVSKNTALESLCCSDNRLTTLDVSHNTKLTFLDCCDNPLETLILKTGQRIEDITDDRSSDHIPDDTRVEYVD